MITITCDACHERFEVADDAAGTTVPCPKCKVRNGVPAPEGSYFPNPDGPEKDLLFLRPAMFRAKPARFTGLLLLVLAGLGGVIYFLAVQKDPALAAGCGIVAIVALIPLAIWKVTTMASSLEITTQRTISNRGLFSKTTSEVRHSDIKNFQIDQSFQQRIFNTGTIGLSSSGQDGIEIMAKDIPKPYRVREIIDRHRTR